MSADEEYKYFKSRKEGKIYISKAVFYNENEATAIRNIKIVMEGNDKILHGEIDGALCLRETGEKRKTQVWAVVTQDERKIKKIVIQTFKIRKSDLFEPIEENSFTFHETEFERLLKFLSHIKFIDLSNQKAFQIEDLSTKTGRKAIIDAEDHKLIEDFKKLPNHQRADFIKALQGKLTTDEINILLGRKEALLEFEKHTQENDWSEKDWQEFFEREKWVFGYGLDYRIARPFAREATIGAGGIDNKDRAVIDFLLEFTNYTVLVEIKKPETLIFKGTRGGRSGTWEFSSEFISAVSQLIEQKAQWLSYASSAEHYSKYGEPLVARTRNAKSVLVIGSTREFASSDSKKEENIKRDTFELFRRDIRSIDILTFDELLERARFITQSK